MTAREEALILVPLEPDAFWGRLCCVRAGLPLAR